MLLPLMLIDAFDNSLAAAATFFLLPPLLLLPPYFSSPMAAFSFDFRRRFFDVIAAMLFATNAIMRQAFAAFFRQIFIAMILRGRYAAAIRLLIRRHVLFFNTALLCHVILPYATNKSSRYILSHMPPCLHIISLPENCFAVSADNISLLISAAAAPDKA